jgi:quinol monooxygenase YgiN
LSRDTAFVEHLRFRVDPGQSEAFLAHNRRWLAALQRQPGFLAQHTYRQSEDADVWLILVLWQDDAAMQAVPDELQQTLDNAEHPGWALETAEHYWEVEE